MLDSTDRSLRDPVHDPLDVRPKGSAGKAYSTTCPCGRLLIVEPAQAGGQVKCACGANVEVPRLSLLRLAVGLGAYESGPFDTVLRLLQSGALPSASACAWSHLPTDDVLLVRVDVPILTRSEESDTVPRALFLGGIFAGVIGLMIAGLSRASHEMVQAEVRTLVVPLRVASGYQSRVAGLSMRRLKRLLRSEPAYAALLDALPETLVGVVTMSDPTSIISGRFGEDLPR